MKSLVDFLINKLNEDIENLQKYEATDAEIAKLANRLKEHMADLVQALDGVKFK